MEIVIASRNVHKIREFRELFKPLKQFDVLSLHQFPDFVELPEEGKNFAENALTKAQHAAHHLKKWVLADDSGLIIPALQGAPGIYSRRYSGENASDSENRRKLLADMQELTGIARSGYFECALAFCKPDGSEKCVSGICEGNILTEERGQNGFGYDPIFVKHDYDKTFAELGDSLKNKISHRYKAFQKLSLILENLKV